MQKVIFFNDYNTDEVFAYFVDLMQDDYLHLCFCLSEGHSSCDPKYVENCDLAKFSEYSDTAFYLLDMGYELDILNETHNIIR